LETSGVEWCDLFHDNCKIVVCLVSFDGF
jgi:hypothetical protein